MVMKEAGSGKRVVSKKAARPLRCLGAESSTGTCGADGMAMNGVSVSSSSTYAVKSFFFAVEGSGALGESISYRLPLLSRERTPVPGSMPRIATSSSTMRVSRPDEEVSRNLWSSASPRMTEGRHGANAFFYAWERYRNENSAWMSSSSSSSTSSSLWKVSAAAAADGPSYERMAMRGRSRAGAGDAGPSVLGGASSLRISSLQLERGSKRDRGVSRGGGMHGGTVSAGGPDAGSTSASSSVGSISANGSTGSTLEHAKHSCMLGRKIRRQAASTRSSSSSLMTSASSSSLSSSQRKPDGVETSIRNCKAPIHVRLSHNDLRSLLLTGGRQQHV